MKRSSKDKKYHSFAGCGVDVSMHRADDLDKICLENISRANHPRVLDLGCGAAGQSFRMAEAGASVLALDKYDFSEHLLVLQNKGCFADSQLKFVQGDVLNILPIIKDERFFSVCMQRVVHYLKYKQAQELLKQLRLITDDTFYISVTGVESLVGDYYKGRNLSIHDRFLTLESEGVDLFSITEPVCLYTKAEFQYLLEDTGWNIKRLWTSDFGNHKAVCS